MGVITTRPWPPTPTLRTTLLRYWYEGRYGFWVEGLRQKSEWTPPWYGSLRRPWSIAQHSYSTNTAATSAAAHQEII